MKAENTASGSEVDHEALVRSFTHLRFLDLFLGQSRRAQAGLMISVGILAWIWFNRSPTLVAAGWGLVALAVATWRFLYTASFVRGAASAAGATGRVIFVLALNGALMAVPLLAFPVLSQLERAAFSIVLLALATASAATTSGYRLIFVAFAAPMLLPLALAWAQVEVGEGSRAGPWGLAGLIVFFLLFLLSFGRSASRIFEEASRYRYGEAQRNRELQDALQRADESSRAKTQFLASASHDLRQPLHSMTALVAALTLRELDGRTREIIDRLDQVNQGLSRQLDSLLDISQLDAGTLKPRLDVHRLDLLLRRHHDQARPLVEERRLRLVLEPGTGEPSVLTDEVLLGRVVNNLIDNAIKYNRAGGQISLRLQTNGERVELSVSDTGIGIPPGEQQRVFQEFYQVADVSRDRSKGLGLGLSIVSRICSLLGITLELSSEPGVGTRVSLGLPVLAVTAQAVPPEIAKVAMPAGLAVLVIDDEDMVRQSMRLLLTQLGCSVHLASGTQEALAIAARCLLDVVLSDFRLREGESGIEAIAAVRKLRPQLVSALITGDTAPDRLREATAAGMPLLHKPVSLPKLLEVLQPAVEAADARQKERSDESCAASE